MFLSIAAISVLFLKWPKEDRKSIVNAFVLQCNNIIRTINEHALSLNSDTAVGSSQGPAFATSPLPLLLAAGRKCGSSSPRDFGAQLETFPGGSSRCGPQQEPPKSNQTHWNILLTYRRISCFFGRTEYKTVDTKRQNIICNLASQSLPWQIHIDLNFQVYVKTAIKWK